MSNKTQKSVIQRDGLRYSSKSGSALQLSAGAGIRGHMSCFLCGSFRAVSELKTRNLMGKQHKVCSGGCKAG